MAMWMVFTPTERRKLAVLVNNISVFAIQLLQRDASAVFMVALKNIRRVQQEHEQLLKKLDELAREQADESPLRLIEDMARSPRDMAQMLGLIRRCLAASAFLGHCLAQPTEGVCGRLIEQDEQRLQ